MNSDEVLASLEEAYADMMQREEHKAAMRSSEQLIPPQRRRVLTPRGSVAGVLQANTYPSEPQESSLTGKHPDTTAKIWASINKQVKKHLS